MKQHIKILIKLLTENDLKASLAHYIASSESENIAQLAFLFQHGQKDLSAFEFYQQITTKFIESKSFPENLIAQIKTNDILSFFTPALQLNENFSKINNQQRNVLHCLFDGSLLAGNAPGSSVNHPPFNYLRSMMLFESNDSLRNALCQRDDSNLTPVEIYLFSHPNLTDLPAHELTSLLALFEIESKQQVVDVNNYNFIIQSIRKLYLNQQQLISSERQRVILTATYYTKPIQKLVTDLTDLQ